MLKTAIKLAVLGMAFLGISVGGERAAHAQRVQTVYSNTGFENQPNVTGWWFSGHTGFTTYPGAGAHSGSNDFWMNNWNPADWNSANTEVYPSYQSADTGYCDISWWEQTSANIKNTFLTAYEDLGGGSLTTITSQSLNTSTNGWAQQTMRASGPAVDHAIIHGKPILFTFGFWGQGAPGQWVGLDDVHIECWVWQRP